MDNLKIKWQDIGQDIGQKPWIPFNLSDINHMSRTHAINLFSNKTPVIAKQGDAFIVNTGSLHNDYKRKGKKVMLFSELEPSDKMLSSVGFL